MIYDYIMGACWLAFVGYWVVSSIGVKKDRQHHVPLWVSVGARLLIAAAVLLVVRLSHPGQIGRALPRVAGVLFHFEAANPFVRGIGAVFCVAGIAVAIWARTTLGRNWSARPATKQDHELVTSGPYRLVRHPIYSGMILAMVGTALIAGLVGFLVLAAFTGIAIYRVGVEERMMIQLFADAYVEYRRHTKALIPFVV